MTDRAQLEALRDRLAKATGPDRMLDIALHRWLFPAHYEPTPLGPGEEYPPDGFGTFTGKCRRSVDGAQP